MEENKLCNTPPTAKANSLKKLRWSVAILSFALASAFVIYFSLNHLNLNPKNGGISNTNTSTLKTGWKFYRNNVLGLQFSYPETWGDPYTTPDYITDLNSVMNGEYEPSAHFIEIHFENFPNSVYLTLYDNVVPGDSRNLNSQIMNWGFYKDNIATLRQTGNICDYHVAYDHNNWIEVLKELDNVCQNGIKRSFIELSQYFSGNNPETLYSYYLSYYYFTKAGNPIFNNVLVHYYAKIISQNKSTLTYEQFLNASPDPYNFKNVDDSDFTDFVKSIKAIEPVKNFKTEMEVGRADTEGKRLFISYHNAWANNDYKTSYSYLLNPKENYEEYVANQKNIYDQVVKEINQIGGNRIEVFVDVQLQNRKPETYREVYEIKNGKLEKKYTDRINGGVSEVGNMRTYAAEREENSIVVLQGDGEEKIIDSTPAPSDYYGNAGHRFYSAHFSPSGNYILYGVAFYEGGSSNVYDVRADKIYPDITEGKFNKDETLYFTCQFSEAYGPTEAVIYKVPGFTVKNDLLKLHPNLSKYMNYSCSNDEKTNIETFEFSESFDGDAYGTSTKEIYRFNSLTGEPIN